MWRVFPEYRRSLSICGAAVALAATCPSRSADLESHFPCRIVAEDWADGDSFRVEFPDGKRRVIRLYFVDCIEKTVSQTTDKRRLREQSRHFGIEDPGITLRFGREASEFTFATLARPFTVYTALAKAPGRSGLPRYYAFVQTADGEDLAALLVRRGLARAHGLGRTTPSGEHRDDRSAYLDDLELVAALTGAGVWAHSDPAQIVALRKKERDDMRSLEAIDDALTLSPPDSPIDVNTASLDQLMRSGLRESLADAVIRMRPFRRVDDLIEVRGIGPVTLEKIRPHLVIGEPPEE